MVSGFDYCCHCSSPGGGGWCQGEVELDITEQGCTNHEWERCIIQFILEPVSALSYQYYMGCSGLHSVHCLARAGPTTSSNGLTEL